MEKENENEQIKALKEQLFYEAPNAGRALDDAQLEAADAFCEGYKRFLDDAKTEREAVAATVAMAEGAGFVPYEYGNTYKPGDKVYLNNRGKAVILAVFGVKSVAEGVKISAAHIDSPRLDLKQNPMYEDHETAFFKTHYYGGIKKYQWPTIPLALHGVIVKRNGETVRVRVGEDDADPKFVITDLLPHLGREQSKRTLGEGVKAEELNVLIGSRPFRGDKTSESVKLNILNLLFEKYGVTEHDFLSAELEIVPAFKACDIGFDRSLIGAYGHDDRVDAYPSVMASLAAEAPAYTTLTVLADKEEIGSEGNTGLASAFMEHFIDDLAATQGVAPWNVLRKSECLSADVTAAFDPTFSDVMDARNCAYVNKGVAVMKYTGHGGKSGSSDASAEYMGKIRALFDGADVLWQLGALGKVDAGGGGTVAKFVSKLNIDTVDIGVPVLSMHAPFEVVSKTDVYMTYLAIKAFFEQA